MFLNPTTIMPPSDVQEVQSEEWNTVTAAKVFQAVKYAGCDEIRPEMLKPWVKELCGEIVCVKWHGILEWHQNIDKIKSSWNTWKKAESNITTIEAFLSSIPGKVYPKYCTLKKDASK